jgi:hypothetical protein
LSVCVLQFFAALVEFVLSSLVLFSPLFPLLSGSSCVSVGCCVIHLWGMYVLMGYMLLYIYVWMHYAFITYNLLCGPSASTVCYTSLPFFCVIHLLLFILRSLFCCVFALWFLFYTMYVFFNLFSLVCPCLNCAVRGGFLVLLCWVCVVYCCFSLKLLVLLRSVVICEHVKDWVGGHGLRVVEVVVFD